MLEALRRSRASIATWENLRIVRTGPRSERGGTIAWTLEQRHTERRVLFLLSWRSVRTTKGLNDKRRS
jgi:hypothetical protein